MQPRLPSDTLRKRLRSLPDWNMDGNDYTSLASYQSANGEGLHSLYTDPRMITPTYHTIGFAASHLKDFPVLLSSLARRFRFLQ